VRMGSSSFCELWSVREPALRARVRAADRRVPRRQPRPVSGSWLRAISRSGGHLRPGRGWRPRAAMRKSTDIRAICGRPRGCALGLTPPNRRLTTIPCGRGISGASNSRSTRRARREMASASSSGPTRTRGSCAVHGRTAPTPCHGDSLSTTDGHRSIRLTNCDWQLPHII
jgi:hypothetical protein